MWICWCWWWNANAINLDECSWARIGARWANKADVKKLNRVTGIVLTILGIIMFIA